MTSTATAIPKSVNATMTNEELFATLSLAMSWNVTSNVTPESILDATEALSAGPLANMANRIGVISIGSTLFDKKVMDKFTIASETVLPDEWKINNSINYSMFAMTGHMIYLLDDSKLTDAAKSGRQVYTKSLGGALDIKAYGSSGTVKGKPERSQILREWSERLSGADLDRIAAVFSKAYPDLVLPTSTTLSGYKPVLVLSLLESGGFLFFPSPPLQHLRGARNLLPALLYPVVQAHGLLGNGNCALAYNSIYCIAGAGSSNIATAFAAEVVTGLEEIVGVSEGWAAERVAEAYTLVKEAEVAVVLKQAAVLAINAKDLLMEATKAPEEVSVEAKVPSEPT